jgi:DNA-binding Lrp family transcriptional regulator
MAKDNLDRTDFEILAALQKNARFSNKELAALVGLAASSCLERVRRLTQRGVLKGFHAEVDPASLGIEIEAMIAVRLERHSREDVDRFRAHVMGLPETVALYHLSGANDFLVHVAVRDTHHLRELVLEAFTTRPEVAHLETALVFGHTRSAVLPDYRKTEAKRGP